MGKKLISFYHLVRSDDGGFHISYFHLSRYSRPRSLFVVSCLLFLTGLLLFPFASAYENSGTLREGQLFRRDVSGESDSSKYLEIRINFTYGKLGDVYILTHDEYDNLSAGRDFEAAKEFERRSSFGFSWMQKDDDNYYLVIDNADNAHPNDARPNGDLSFEIEYHQEDYKDDETIWQLWAVAICTTIFIVVVVIVIARVVTRLIRGPGEQADRGGMAYSSMDVDMNMYSNPPPPSFDGNDRYQSPSDRTLTPPGPPGRAMSSNRDTQSDHRTRPGSPIAEEYKPPKPPDGTVERPRSAPPPLPIPSPIADFMDDPITKAPPATKEDDVFPKPPSSRKEPDVENKCPECHETIRSDSKIFPHSPTPLKKRPTICPDCGADVEPDWKACPRCTAALR